MNKLFFKISLLFHVATAMVWTTVADSHAQQPNIVLIVVDDAGYVDFGFMGSTEIPTPNLDALASTGVVFTQAYTGQACSPSRAAFLTGIHHSRLGYEANLQNTNDPINEHFEGLPNAVVTVFERLKSLGYSTSVTGKWHVGGVDDIVVDGKVTVPGNKPPKQGVDHFVGFQAGGGLQEMFLNADGTNNITNVSSNGQYWSDFWGDRAIGYIDQHYTDTNPFFLYVSFNDPHSPIQEAPSFNDPLLNGLTGQRRRYASEMLTVDNNVGRIVEKLRDPNSDGDVSDSILDTTLIVFLNDNGGVLGNSADNGTLRDQKGSPYEGGIRVPMFMTGAGVVPSQVVTSFDKMVHSIDIVPTVVAAAGGSVPKGAIDGVNLLPFINGTDNSNPHTFLAQRVQEEIQYRLNDWKLVKNGYAGSWELYDFSNASSQSEAASADLAAANPTQVELMQRLLTDWEVTVDKQRFPSTDENIAEFNLFDNFEFRPGSGNFSSVNRWTGPDGSLATMRDRDSYVGTVFRFETSSTDYSAFNDLQRMNELEFIAHGFEFAGNVGSAVHHSGSVLGFPIILANNLDGEPPFIELSATRPVDRFWFHHEVDLLLYDDLIIDGDGSQGFHFGGDISEYVTGRCIRKSGSAKVVFAGNIDATGAGYLATEGSSIFNDNAVLSGDLVVSENARVDLCGMVVGTLENSGILSVAENTPEATVVTASLLPLLGDGDIDSRNTASAGDQDSQVLVGAVANATATQNERVQRSLFSFDLAEIPNDASINAVSLTLQFDGNDPSSANNISGDLELYSMTEAPVFDESVAENVDWNHRDRDNSVQWATSGGSLGLLVANLPNASLPNPRTTTAGQAMTLNSLPALKTVIKNQLEDDEVSFAMLLPGEEVDAANMVGDRDLYRFGCNESTASSPAVLEIEYETEADRDAHIEGDLVQLESGSLHMAIDSVPEFSHLSVSGAVHVAGSLVVVFANDYMPEDGQSFELVSANVLTGEFHTIEAIGLGERFEMEVIYSEAAIFVQVVESDILVGDINCDGNIDLLDVSPFVAILIDGGYVEKADINQDGAVNLLDVGPFIQLLAGP